MPRALSAIGDEASVGSIDSVDHSHFWGFLIRFKSRSGRCGTHRLPTTGRHRCGHPHGRPHLSTTLGRTGSPSPASLEAVNIQDNSRNSHIVGGITGWMVILTENPIRYRPWTGMRTPGVLARPHTSERCCAWNKTRRKTGWRTRPERWGWT